MVAALKTAKPFARSAQKPRASFSTYQQMLVDANVNPLTGLATDYLNHFNEAIMLLEMIADIPECADDFMAWRPRTYREHFDASHLRGRSLIIKAYDEADTSYRARFDHVIARMNSILVAIGDGMGSVNTQKTRIVLAKQGVDWVKPLLLIADGLIHGNATAANDKMDQ